MKNKNISRTAIVTVLLLMVPLVAMQFTNEVDWSLADFIVMGILIFGTGLAYEFVSGKGGNTAYRVAVGVAVGAAFLLIWVNMAVGLIGSGANLPNLMYMGVPAVGFIGAIITRFRPHGMARAMFATAIAQVLVPVIAMIIAKSQVTSGEVSEDIVDMLAATGLFVVLWVVSALLFRHAGTHSHSNAV